MLKLFYAPTSPYARKVMACAHELGIADRIETIVSAGNPLRRDESVAERNPLGKIPTMVTEDGTALFDSPVICEYLDSTAPQPRLFPREGEARWTALTQQAAADGLLDAALMIRHEDTLRREDRQWQDWREAQMIKIRATLGWLESSVTAGQEVTIGTIAAGCALGYLDFRFAGFDWRRDHPRLGEWFGHFGERPSMRATAPFVAA